MVLRGTQQRWRHQAQNSRNGGCQTRTPKNRQVRGDDVGGKLKGPELKNDSYFMDEIQTLDAKKNSVFIMPPSFHSLLAAA